MCSYAHNRHMFVVLWPMKRRNVLCGVTLRNALTPRQDGVCEEDVASGVCFHGSNGGRSVQCLLPEETVLSFGCVSGAVKSQYGGKFDSLCDEDPSLTATAVPFIRCCTSKVL